ncbi:MAG TPA: GAF domain-containing sensor histidine kinase [Gemmatimonadaceae bacterium]
MEPRVPLGIETGLPQSVIGDPAEFERRRQITLPFFFVLLSLAALLIVPSVVLRRAADQRRRLETAQSAHQLVDELELGFARASAVVRTSLIRPDPALRSLYAQLLAREHIRFDSLTKLDRDLGIAAVVDSLQRRAQTWHADQTRLLFGGITEDEYVRLHPLARFMDEDLLHPAEAIADTVELRAERLQRVVARTERWGAAMMAILTLLAAASAVIVARAARNFRVRALQEHMLREAALLLTEAVRLPDVLQRIAIAAARVNHARSAFVERVVQNGTEVEVVASVGELAPARDARVPFSDSLTELALASALPTVIRDVTQSTSSMARRISSQPKRCSALVNVLRADDVVHGALVLVRCDREPYRPGEVAQVRIFGVLASLAIRSAVLFDDLERRHRELQQVTESRERLIRGFTHDVKNPLGAADGYAQLLEEGVVTNPRERQESIRHIRETIKTALSLIDEIVQLARAESGQITVRYQTVSLPDLARRTMNDFRAAAEASGHTLLDELPDQLPQVTTDADRVRQILSNLLSNALKYTPQGSMVRVSASSRHGRRDDDPTEWITVSVSDTGPGIPAGDQKRLFEEFVRLQPSAGPGAGLGLAISQRIARLLGGEITLESGPGVGSRFTLWIPRDRNLDIKPVGSRAA